MTESGLQAVFMASRQQILRFIRARGGGEESEDIVQELWLRVTGQPAAGERTGPIAEPLSYLYRMADNLMLDRRRAAMRRERRDGVYAGLGEGPAPGVSPAPSVEQALIARERLRRVEAALAALGPRTATIFRRFRIDGLNQRDIAAECGLSLSAVEKHLQKAYRALVEMRAREDAESGAPCRLAIEGDDDGR